MSTRKASEGKPSQSTSDHAPDQAGRKPNGKLNGHADPEADEWKVHLQKTKDGNVRSNLANALAALRHAPKLVRTFGLDQMTGLIMLRRFVAGGRRKSGTLPRPLEDVDEGAARDWLQRHAGMTSLTGRELRCAIEMVATDNAFHPVRDYLTELEWDGKVRLYRWIERYLGAERSAYAGEIGKRFLVAMVARVMQPGCQCDYTLVLEGPQGSGKSTACRILAGDWFSDNLPDLNRCDPVRLSMHLQGKWLIEIPEMSAIGRSGVDALKAFLTQTQERYTRKYARNETVEPRQCVFIGSTNETAGYLHDHTGARRFWPVLTGKINTEALRRDRDQLLAEAMQLYREGIPWWPDAAFEREHFKPQQEARREPDPWEERIGDYLASRVKTTVTEVARAAIGLQFGKLGTAEQRQISRVLEGLGWVRGTRDNHSRPWTKKPSA